MAEAAIAGGCQWIVRNWAAIKLEGEHTRERSTYRTQNRLAGVLIRLGARPLFLHNNSPPHSRSAR
jgi:hypothetical protein